MQRRPINPSQTDLKSVLVTCKFDVGFIFDFLRRPIGDNSRLLVKRHISGPT